MKILVVVHPDDEIIWFNPQMFDKIIICFLDRLDKFTMTVARKRVLFRHPLKDKIKCLELPEPNFYKDSPRYQEIINQLKELLAKEIEQAEVIYTHDPETGEYGHEDHKLVGQIVKEIAQCPVYALDMKATSNTPNRIARPPNLPLFYQVRQLYQEENAWTWFGDFYPRHTLYYKKINEK